MNSINGLRQYSGKLGRQNEDVEVILLKEEDKVYFIQTKVMKIMIPKKNNEQNEFWQQIRNLL